MRALVVERKQVPRCVNMISYPGVIPINITKRDLLDAVKGEPGGWGVDVVFDASGEPSEGDRRIGEHRLSGGAIVPWAFPSSRWPSTFPARSARNCGYETVFRYANMYERALNLIGSGKVDLKPLISSTFDFERSIEAFEPRRKVTRPT